MRRGTVVNRASVHLAQILCPRAFDGSAASALRDSQGAEPAEAKLAGRGRAKPRRAPPQAEPGADPHEAGECPATSVQ